MRKRVLAILLCLSVLLTACACAAETAEPPAVSDPESKAPAPQFTLSEVNAESSTTEEPAAPSETAPAEPSGEIPPIETSDESLTTEESDVVIEPIQPVEPVKPEEKETTLEFLREFPIGETGIKISMHYYDDPTYSSLECPFQYFADREGNIYYFWYKYFVNLQTGERLKVSGPADNFCSLAAEGGILYGLTIDGKLQSYSLSEGLLSSVQIGSAEDSFAQNIWVQNDGTVVVTKQDKLYDKSGGLLSNFAFSYSKNPEGESGVLSIGEKVFVCDDYDGVLSGAQGYLTTHKTQAKQFGTAQYIEETIYRRFDENGNVLFAFSTTTLSKGEYLPCSIFDSQGNECKWYYGCSLSIGQNGFDGVLASNIFQGADNTLYLLLQYPDRGELYRIDPGYSNIGLRNLDDMTLEDLMDPMEEASVGSSLLSGEAAPEATTEDTTIQHAPLAWETVRRRANFLVNLQWKLTRPHVTLRTAYKDYIDFPAYYSGCIPESGPFEADMEGIPYCVGGMNGYETFDAEDDNYVVRSFLGSLTRIVDQGLPCTIGNIAKRYTGSGTTYRFVPYTAGVDCSGFVGSTCGIAEKEAPSGLKDYGHKLDSWEELEPYDIIISKTHCYFFVSFGSDGKRANVIDCTSEEETDNKTEDRSISVSYLKTLECYRPYYTFEKTATHHRYYCTHPDCAGTSNAEASAWIAHVWETPDPENPSVQYCKICNFCSQHTFTYTYSTTAHTATCVDCSYTVTENHDMNESYNLTMHTHYCAECGYSVTASHAMETEYNGTSHWYQCTGCDYTNMQETHTFTYTTYNLTRHRKTCSVCDYSELNSHLLSYSYDIDGHWQECSVCDYATLPFNHTFVDGYCSVCGAGNLIIAALPPEDEPLPVPEDQKATL